jgi:hypothetical protein
MPARCELSIGCPPGPCREKLKVSKPQRSLGGTG